MTAESKLNIGFYRYSLLNRGGDRLSLAYANYLASAGHSVTLHVKEIDTVFEISPRLKVNFIRCKNRLFFLMHALTNHLKHDFVVVDIIHLHLLLSLHNKVVYYAQADDIEYYNGRFMRTLVDVLYRLFFRSGSTMISMSQHLTNIFSRRYSTACNIITLKTGIDHDTFYPDIDNNLLEMKGKKKAVFLMARGDAFRKGFDIAVRVLEMIPEEIAADMELWVCGNQLDSGNFKFRLRNFGVVSDKRLRQILSSADIFFYPSRHEGFGLFPLEAMACGCVVITSSAIPYASESPSILFSPVGDIQALLGDLKSLVTDDELLRLLRENAFKYARSYDFENSKVAFAEAIRTIAGRE